MSVKFVIRDHFEEESNFRFQYCISAVSQHSLQLKLVNPGFPLGLENLENLEKFEGIFQSGKSQGILNRLEKSGKTTQNTGKLR